MSKNASRKNQYQRRLFSESLENRVLMASDVFHNFLEPHDVNDDRMVSPIDALQIINRLNKAEDSPNHHAFEDVNDDRLVSPLDALVVINKLNASTTNAQSTQPIKVVTSPTSAARVRVEVETEGAETELSIRMENAAANKAFAVTLNDVALGEIMTDSRGRGQIKLSDGDDNRRHLDLPPSVVPLSPTMELVIGDVVRGKLGDVARIESGSTGGGGSSDDNSSDDNSSDDNSSDDNGSDDSSSSSSNEIHLRATFPITNRIQRSAEYESETERGVTKRKFKAEIEKAAANTTYAVKVGGVEVGSITTDAKGKGRIILSSNPKDAREQPMPASFPAVAVGTEVMIGDLASTFKLSV